MKYRGREVLPIVLLVGEDGFDSGIGGAHYVMNKSYAENLERLCMIPFLAYDIRNVEEYVEFADMLILTGGANIHPRWYGKCYQNSVEMEGLSQERDDLDFALCRRFIEEEKPILAIGRGLQVVNVALGGTLCQDIYKKTGQNHQMGSQICGTKENTDDRQGTSPSIFHTVLATEDSILSECCGNRLFVNSYHSQGIEILGTGLTAAYQAEDGTVEAFFHKELPILGVQWHPEQPDWEGKSQVRFFEAFRRWIEGKSWRGKTKKRRKPLVLIDGGPALDRQFWKPSWVTNKTYPSAVSAAGGVPLMPLAESMAEEYAYLADALILTGSISFVPHKELKKRLNQEEFLKREKLDEALFWSFYREKKPVLGICFGFQMMNCYLGGTLEERFKFRTGVEHMLHQHRIRVSKESIWYDLFGESFWVNSRHNDKIDVVAKELRITAWSEDGVVEAFEHRTLPIYGVEWHPERMRGDFREPPEGPDMTEFFIWFIHCSYLSEFICWEDREI